MKLDSLINGRTIHFGGFYTVFVVKMISHHPLIENQKPIIHSFTCISVNPFTKRQILDSSKLKGFADNNYILMKIAESLFLKRVENTVGKGEIAHHEQPSAHKYNTLPQLSSRTRHSKF